MIILDTNVLSALMYLTPDKKVVAWLDQQPRTSIWTTSVTVLEVRFGLQIMPGRKRRSALIQAFDGVLDKIGHRVVAFDVAAKAFDLVKKQGATVVAATDEATLNTQLQFILQKKILLEDEEPAKK